MPRDAKGYKGKDARDGDEHSAGHGGREHLLYVQRELRDSIVDGVYDHIVIFTPPIVIGDTEHVLVSIVAALALVARKSEVPFTIIGVGTDAVWKMQPSKADHADHHGLATSG
jgi:hypothetical protein